MKKKLLLSGLIIATIALALISLYDIVTMILSLFIFSGLFAGDSSVTADSSIGSLLVFVAIMIALLMFFIVALVLNSVSINAWDKIETYKNKKATMITAVVFNFLVIVFLTVVSILVGSYTTAFAIATLVICLIMILALIVSNVLIIIDISVDVNIDSDKVEDEDKKNSQILKLNNDLDMLYKLKNNGKISKEEYDKIKAKIINENLLK